MHALAVSCNLRPGMRLLVDLFQAFGRDVRVDLRGGKIGVAEEFLDAAQIRAGVEHVRGETVTQFVRSQRGVESDGKQILLQHPLDAARGHSAPEAVDKNGAA